MSESLPSIGAHCSVSSCNINDFLPIRCKCDKLFCRDHIFPDNHACPVALSAPQSSDSAPQAKLQRCAVERCSKPSLEAFISNSTDVANRTPAICAGCRQSFCASHRDSVSHSCSNEYLALTETKNEAAREILAKNFPSSQSADKAKTVTPRPSKAPSNPKKAAQLRQVALMKMRHHAQPGDPRDRGKDVPLDRRLHVIVKCENNAAPAVTLWFRKTIGAGKALDILATHFNVVASDPSPLHLVKRSDPDADAVILRTDLPLADQVEDGSHLLLTH